MKTGVNVIVHSLHKEPHRWEINKLWAKHDNGLTIWVGSGFFNCRIEKPNYQELGLLNRWTLYRAIRNAEQSENE